jgi:Fe-S cluster assembly protein SufB
VALTNNYQQADTGTKMIHIREKHQEHNHVKRYLRGPGKEYLPRAGEDHEGQPVRAITPSVISLLLSDKCGAHTFPYLGYTTTPHR